VNRVSGQVVKVLDGYGEAGQHVITWNGTNAQGTKVSSGVYFYKVQAGTYTEARSMIMLK
jgi:flagellar hook assembly protein FlgD